MIQIPKKLYETCDEDRTLVPVGRYAVQITGATENSEDNYLAIAYKTLAPLVGIKSEERFFLSEKAIRRFGALCKRLGLADRGQPFEAADAHEFDENDLVGRQLVVDVIHETLTRKNGEPYTVSKWDFMGFWDVRDTRPEVADFLASLSRAKESRAATPAPTQKVLVGADSEM